MTTAVTGSDGCELMLVMTVNVVNDDSSVMVTVVNVMVLSGISSDNVSSE